MPVTTVESIAELRRRLDAARAAGRSVGFVPTMGYLHDGHASLMRTARTETDLVVTSIFVNPLQFAPGEDLDAYPRDLARDTDLAERCGVDVLFVPSVSEVYPEPVRTTVSVPALAATLEGRSRPTHLDGVATVVAKLFSIVGACRAYFGEKDFQQLAVVRRMARDLSMPVSVVGCPTVREPDGLAMSSRNTYLSPDDRAAAPVLHEALRAGAALVASGATDPAVVRATMEARLRLEPAAELDYLEVVDADTLERIDPLVGEVRLLGAARFGAARLIDNVGAQVPPAGAHAGERR